MDIWLQVLALGFPCEHYRPSGTTAPLAEENRLGTLRAAFDQGNGGFSRPSAYGKAAFIAWLDGSRTAPGDYLVGPGGTFFIARQVPMLPVVAVKCNRTVSVFRLGLPSSGFGDEVGYESTARSASA